MAVALLAGSFTLTSADAARDDSFRVTAVSYQFREVDAKPKGESIGDYFVFSDNLFKHKRRIGQLDGQCTVTRLDRKANSFTQQCLVTATLPRGHLTVQGVITFTDPEQDTFTLAVTGGTGAYAGAGGEVHVTFVSDTVTKIHVVLN
jgi:hypothetical protein